MILPKIEARATRTNHDEHLGENRREFCVHMRASVGLKLCDRRNLLRGRSANSAKSRYLCSLALKCIILLGMFPKTTKITMF